MRSYLLVESRSIYCNIRCLCALGGKENQCACLEDKFGVSWQIVPNVLIELLSDPDPLKAGRVMQAMMQITKIDIAGLKQAYEQQ